MWAETKSSNPVPSAKLNMKKIIDLKGLETKNEVLEKFSKELEFGVYENGELVASDNLDAFEDSMRLLEEGGVFGTGVKLTFPLEIVVNGAQDFKTNSPDDFVTFKDVLDGLVQFYSSYNLKLDIKMNIK